MENLYMDFWGQIRFKIMFEGLFSFNGDRQVDLIIYYCIEIYFITIAMLKLNIYFEKDYLSNGKYVFLTC